MKSMLLVIFMIVGLSACQKSRLENVLGQDDQINRVAPPATPNSIHPPAADVEVIDPQTGNATTVVNIGRDYWIRPTVDTVDTDDNPFADPATCKNNGIETIQVSVDPASEGSNVTRQRQGCQEGFEDITYRFNQAGKATVTMVAKTAEASDSATAVATVEVMDPNVSFNGNDWFDLSGTRLVLRLDENGKSDAITFRGYCQASGIPGSVFVHPEPGQKLAVSQQTNSVTHQYEKAGVYEVRGFCLDVNRNMRESIVTVVVLPQDGSQISSAARFRGDNFDFNDFPGQNGPSQNSPSQTNF